MTELRHVKASGKQLAAKVISAICTSFAVVFFVGGCILTVKEWAGGKHLVPVEARVIESYPVEKENRITDDVWCRTRKYEYKLGETQHTFAEKQDLISSGYGISRMEQPRFHFEDERPSGTVVTYYVDPGNPEKTPVSARPSLNDVWEPVILAIMMFASGKMLAYTTIHGVDWMIKR